MPTEIIHPQDFERYYRSTNLYVHNALAHITGVASTETEKVYTISYLQIGDIKNAPFERPHYAVYSKKISAADFADNVSFVSPQYGYVDLPFPLGGVFCSLRPVSQFTRGFTLRRITRHTGCDLSQEELLIKLLYPSYMSPIEALRKLRNTEEAVIPINRYLALRTHGQLYYKEKYIGDMPNSYTVLLNSSYPLLEWFIHESFGDSMHCEVSRA